MFQAAYRVSHPFTYNKSGRGAYYGMWIACTLALLIHLPSHVLQFTVLQPENYITALSEFFDGNRTAAQAVYDNVIRVDNYPYYRPETHPGKYCGRQWVKGSFDLVFFVDWFLVFNLTAVALVIGSSLVILFTLRRSNKKLGGDHAKQAKLNRRVAKSSLIMTFTTLGPWLPNLLYSIFCMHYTCPTRGVSAVLADLTLHLYFFVPWVFALMNMAKNPALNKPQKEMLEKTIGSITTYTDRES
eukprot:sb/3468963/